MTTPLRKLTLPTHAPFCDRILAFVDNFTTAGPVNP